MGVDLLDIMFRIERQWGIRIPDEALVQAGARPERKWDMSGQDLMKLIFSRARQCGRCRYDLRGHAGQGHCPECGKAFMVPADEQECWRELQKILAEALRLELQEIKPESLLVRDLGCT